MSTVIGTIISPFQWRLRFLATDGPLNTLKDIIDAVDARRSMGPGERRRSRSCRRRGERPRRRERRGERFRGDVVVGMVCMQL